jgi:hypothetical protein
MAPSIARFLQIQRYRRKHAAVLGRVQQSLENWNAALFERAVGTKQDRGDIDPSPRRADPRRLPFAAFLLRCWRIDRLSLRLGRPRRSPLPVSDFGIGIAAHARLNRASLRDETR